MRGLSALIAILLIVLSVAACAGPARPDRDESARPSRSVPAPAPTFARSATGELVVCARVAPLVAEANGAFNSLPVRASTARRDQAAATLQAAQGHIRRIVAEAGLRPGNRVRSRALAVAAQTARVARLLRAGAAVGNGGLQRVQSRLAAACRVPGGKPGGK